MARWNLRWIWSSAEQPRYSMRLTWSGFGFLVASLITGIVSLQQGTNVLVVLFGIFVGAVFINGLSGWWALRRMEILRVLPEAAVAGAPCTIHYVLRSQRRWARAYALRLTDRVSRGNSADGVVRDVESFVPVLRPNHELTVAVPTVWPRRGVVRFRRLTISTRFPFRLFMKRRTERTEDELVVFPRLMRVRTSVRHGLHAADTTRSSENGRERPPGDDEFYGLRPYRSGDNPRRIHWRRTARTGEVFVRELSRLRQSQFWIVVNTRHAAADLDAAHRVELAISGAATLICDVLDQSGKVGLIVNGSPALVSPPGSGPALRGRLLRELAERQDNHDEPLSIALQRLSWASRWRGKVVLLGPNADDDLRVSAAWLAQHAGPVTTLVPGTAVFDSYFAPPAEHPAAWIEPFSGESAQRRLRATEAAA